MDKVGGEVGGRYLLDQPEELQHDVLIDRRNVADALSKEPLELGAIAIDLLCVRLRGHARVLRGQLETQHVSPLRQGLMSTFRPDKGVG